MSQPGAPADRAGRPGNVQPATKEEVAETVSYLRQAAAGRGITVCQFSGVILVSAQALIPQSAMLSWIRDVIAYVAQNPEADQEPPPLHPQAVSIISSLAKMEAQRHR